MSTPMGEQTDDEKFPARVYKETVLAPLFEGVKRHHWRYQMEINQASAVLLVVGPSQVSLRPHVEKPPWKAFGMPPDAIVLGAPVDDMDGVFDRLVGQLAAAIDAGADPQAAFREAVAGAGWEPAEA